MSGGRSPRFKSVHLWWVAACCLLLVVSFKVPIGQKLGIAVAPLLEVAQAPVGWFQRFSLWFEEADALQSRYVDLREAYAREGALAQELVGLRAENTQLRQLLHIVQDDQYIWHAARVVSRSLEKKSQRLMLQTAAVVQDDVVVSHEGLVGLVDVLGSRYATVRTILDASLAIPVMLPGSPFVGLVRGNGDRLSVDDVPLAKAPAVGDILLTSGAGGLFPAGLAVAVVEHVTEVGDGVFSEVSARPAASWERDAWLAVAKRNKVQ